MRTRTSKRKRAAMLETPSRGGDKRCKTRGALAGVLYTPLPSAPRRLTEPETRADCYTHATCKDAHTCAGYTCKGKDALPLVPPLALRPPFPTEHVIRIRGKSGAVHAAPSSSPSPCWPASALQALVERRDACACGSLVPPWLKPVLSANHTAPSSPPWPCWPA